MLDPDISTSEALRHLSRPDAAVVSGDRVALDRRRFLQLVGAGLGASIAAGSGSSLLDTMFGGEHPAWAAGPIGDHDGVLVVIGFLGGNDGLNTVVPVADGHYYSQRGTMAIPQANTLHLDTSTGLHPALTELKRLWDAGQLAIVEGVGHRIDDFSHFSSMAKWMAGRPTGIPDSGWLGRWLDGYLDAGPDLFAAAAVGHSVPLHLIGERSIASTVPVDRPDFGVPRTWRPEADEVLFSTIRSLADGAPTPWAERVARSQADQLTIAQTLSPVLPAEPVGEPIVQQMEVAARLINANLGFRVISTGYGDFDSHAGQAAMHTARMTELNDAIRRFFQVLHPRWGSRVTVATFSEFGRTSHGSNDGTDHGSSGPQLVLGANVRGGRHGQRPALAGLGRWDRMNTPVDLRDYYGSLIDGWLGGGGSTVVPGYTEDLRLFRHGPGDGGATVPTHSGSNRLRQANRLNPGGTRATDN